MTAITIDIPNGAVLDDGSIEMAPDAAGKWFYIKYDDKPIMGEVEARMTYAVKSVNGR